MIGHRKNAMLILNRELELIKPNYCKIIRWVEMTIFLDQTKSVFLLELFPFSWNWTCYDWHELIQKRQGIIVEYINLPMAIDEYQIIIFLPVLFSSLLCVRNMLWLIENVSLEYTKFSRLGETKNENKFRNNTVTQPRFFE